jgi:hypothetical protein
MCLNILTMNLYHGIKSTFILTINNRIYAYSYRRFKFSFMQFDSSNHVQNNATLQTIEWL